MGIGMSNKILVYSANVGRYDDARTDGVKCYTEEVHHDPKKSSLFYKTMVPNFDKYDYSIWLDGDTELKVEPEFLIDTYLKDKDIATLCHPIRNCIYEEAEVCKYLSLDKAEVIDKQMERYRSIRFPKNYGLSATTYIVRRHNDSTKMLGSLWWDNILVGSRRDQLSFDYCRWVLGIPVEWFPYHHFDNFKFNPLFKCRGDHAIQRQQEST